MTSAPAAPALKLDIIDCGTHQCVALNDYRIAGSKPWGGGNVTATFKVDPADLWSAAHTALAALAVPAPAAVGEDVVDRAAQILHDRLGPTRMWQTSEAIMEGYREHVRALLPALSAPRPSRDDAGQAVAWHSEDPVHEAVEAVLLRYDVDMKCWDDADNIRDDLVALVKGAECSCLPAAHPPAPSAEAGMVGEWQPIESAPKDGTCVRLAWSPEDWTTGVAIWRDDRWVASAAFYDSKVGHPHLSFREFVVTDPKLWHRLPAVPAALSGGAS